MAGQRVAEGARVYEPYLLDGPVAARWWPPLVALDEALARAAGPPAAAAHAGVARSLVAEGRADLAEAVAEAVLFGPGTWATHVGRAVGLGGDVLAADGLAAAGRADLQALCSLAGRDWQGETEALVSRELPRWERLRAPGGPGGAAGDAVVRLGRALLASSVSEAFEAVLATARTLGAGPLARFEAYAWDGQRLVGVATPAAGALADLVGLEQRLAPFLDNVEAFLRGRPALATLLYGPRGSGKSTAARGLLERYSCRGLCLVELPFAHLASLASVLDATAQLPRPAVLLLDDLAFDAADERLRPLKSLLEGSLLTRRERVLVVATSNRRHLVRERHGDRPDPEAADVHAWDTHHDRLALADRFGLTITFPPADQRAYLAIVRALAAAAGLVPEASLEARAVRFAAWGNGFSGRTARQFVDRERAASAAADGDADGA
jgi:predicted AAA+ superfamily ATPase